ncbi:MAG: DUF4290 domain-containing protein [Bacteroidales bacterium]|nr:DUF4290 domain-containing protein [Bacteroidales bacterium]
MDYDYNTQRNRLVLPEYGRNIQRMVEHILTVDDKEERNRLAKAIITIMGSMNPHLRDISDFKHKLWDHLAIMSNFKIDIDAPYEMVTPKIFSEKPKYMTYKNHVIKFKHYGSLIEKMIEEAVKMPEGKEKEELTKLIANHMKKSYLTWNKDVVDDALIFKDLAILSGGRLHIDENTRLNDSREIFKNKKRKIQKKK